MSKRLKTLAVWIVLVVIFFAAYEHFESQPSGGAAGSSWSGLFPNLLLILLVAALVLFFFRRVGGGKNILTLRKSTARDVATLPQTRFADVGGAAQVKARLADLVDFLRRPEAWEKAGARLPRGVLLEGPPGTGKTLLARAFAGESKVSFFEVSASEFVEMFVGVGSARVRDLFEMAAKKGTAVLFIDELDAVGRRRGSGSVSYSHQEREQTLNQLLVSLDGFQRRGRVVVMAATNRADVLDQALLRPGRFDLRLRLALPDERERAEILAIHLEGRPVDPALTPAMVAARTERASGADLEGIINEAAMAAARRAGAGAKEAVRLEAQDFDQAIASWTSRSSTFDRLDAALIESGSQLVQTDASVRVRVRLTDGSDADGEIVWADERFLKLELPGGGHVVVARSQVVKLEAGTGTAPADEIRQDIWAHVRAEGA